MNQDVDMYVAKAQDSGEKHLKTFKHRKLWVQVIKGEVDVNGATDNANLTAGDGAGISQVETLNLVWKKGAEFIVFDMPA